MKYQNKMKIVHKSQNMKGLTSPTANSGPQHLAVHLGITLQKSLKERNVCFSVVRSSFSPQRGRACSTSAEMTLKSLELFEKKNRLQNVLSLEWKSKCRRFFKEHFGTSKEHLNADDIIKYKIVIDVILKHGVITHPNNTLFLGWPEPSNPIKLARTSSLKQLMFILTDHEMPKVVESICEEQLRIYLDLKDQSFKETISPSLGYSFTSISLKDELYKSISYYRHQFKDIYSLSPLSGKAQRKYKVLLRLKEKICHSIIEAFKLAESTKL